MNKPEENIGRWTSKEHSLFVEGLKKFGRSWKKISKYIESRNPDQVRSHAQKFDIKVKTKPMTATFLEKKNVITVEKGTQYGEGVIIPHFDNYF